jgi:hypothetical protein
MSLILQRCHKPRPSNIPWHNHFNIIWWKNVIKLLIMSFFQHKIYFLPLTLKFLPQRLILDYSQAILFPCYEIPGFIPIQNHRKNRFSVCFILHILSLHYLTNVECLISIYCTVSGYWGQRLWRNKEERKKWNDSTIRN